VFKESEVNKVMYAKEEAIKELRKIVKPYDTVYTILRHVSRSGMLRHIAVVVPANRKEIKNITYLTSIALGLKLNSTHDGIAISGGGMDMGFSIVYELSNKLFPRGFRIDGIHRNGDTSGWDKDGGYALKQRWL
jgi:hypothetical protein